MISGFSATVSVVTYGHLLAIRVSAPKHLPSIYDCEMLIGPLKPVVFTAPQNLRAKRFDRNRTSADPTAYSSWSIHSLLLFAVRLSH